MNGPQHYAEAERVRASALNLHTADLNGFTGWQRDDLLLLAQVHATLALAAATIDVAFGMDDGPAEGSAWAEATS